MANQISFPGFNVNFTFLIVSEGGIPESTMQNSNRVRLFRLSFSPAKNAGSSTPLVYAASPPLVGGGALLSAATCSMRVQRANAVLCPFS